MRGRLLAVAVAVGAAMPGFASAGDTPWSTIKQLFHEPVTELKQQLRQLERRLPPSKAATVSKPSPKREAPAAATVIPPKRPDVSSDVDTPTAAKADVPPDPTTVTDAPPDPAPPADSVADIPPPDPAPAEPAGEPTESAVEASAAETPMAEPADAEAAAPIPRPRPEVAVSYAAEPPLPPNKSREAFSVLNLPPPSLTKPPPAARSTCGVELAKLGVVASALTPVSEGACGIARPVSVASLGDGATDLTSNAIIECNLAEAFARWLAAEVQPEARKTLGGEVTGLRIAASYHCRTRNGVSGAKLSEHGRGNAIDISAFEIAGRGWIAVGGSHSADEARFFRAIRKSACGPFTTVLGPGSDSYHSDHFHLDLAKRRKGGPSRGLYCK